MFAARQAFSFSQRRAFSVSCRQVGVPPLAFPLSFESVLINRLLVLQSSKVTVLGAAGGIGQPLSLLMKLNPRVTELALYDIRGGPGPLSALITPTPTSAFEITQEGLN
jgi:malate dehydrogenase